MHRRQFLGIVAGALCDMSPARAQRPSGRGRIGALVVGASGIPIGTKAIGLTVPQSLLLRADYVIK